MEAFGISLMLQKHPNVIVFNSLIIYYLDDNFEEEFAIKKKVKKDVLNTNINLKQIYCQNIDETTQSETSYNTKSEIFNTSKSITNSSGANSSLYKNEDSSINNLTSPFE